MEGAGVFDLGGCWPRSLCATSSSACHARLYGGVHGPPRPGLERRRSPRAAQGWGIFPGHSATGSSSVASFAGAPRHPMAGLLTQHWQGGCAAIVLPRSADGWSLPPCFAPRTGQGRAIRRKSQARGPGDGRRAPFPQVDIEMDVRPIPRVAVGLGSAGSTTHSEGGQHRHQTSRCGANNLSTNSSHRCRKARSRAVLSPSVSCTG